MIASLRTYEPVWTLVADGDRWKWKCGIEVEVEVNVLRV